MSSAWQGDKTHQGASGLFGLKNQAGGIVGAGTLIFGSISGGAAAALTGGNFWQGAVTGLIVSGLNHYVHRLEEALARHKFDKEIDTAYDSKADSAAPATDATLNKLVDDVPTLKYWYGKSGKPILWAQSKYTYSQVDGISEAKTFAYDTDNYKSSQITFFKASFASYRILAQNMLHELGHAYYNYTGQMASMIGKYGKYSQKPLAFSEVYAFKFAFQYGGISYSNNVWYKINLAKTK